MATAYNAWVKRNPDLVDLFTGEEDCPMCDGSGEEVCSECGHEHDCTRCDGTGKVKINTSEELNKFFEREHKKDEARLAVWVRSVIAPEVEE